jgi:hypothetical protein
MFNGLHFTEGKQTSRRPEANCISWVEKTGNCWLKAGHMHGLLKLQRPRFEWLRIVRLQLAWLMNMGSVVSNQKIMRHIFHLFVQWALQTLKVSIRYSCAGLLCCLVYCWGPVDEALALLTVMWRYWVWLSVLFLFCWGGGCISKYFRIVTCLNWLHMQFVHAVYKIELWDIPL